MDPQTQSYLVYLSYGHYIKLTPLVVREPSVSLRHWNVRDKIDNNESVIFYLLSTPRISRLFCKKAAQGVGLLVLHNDLYKDYE